MSIIKVDYGEVGGGGISNISMLDANYYLTSNSYKDYTMSDEKMYCGAIKRYDDGATHNEFTIVDGVLTQTNTSYFPVSIESGNVFRITNSQPRPCYATVFEVE